MLQVAGAFETLGSLAAAPRAGSQAADSRLRFAQKRGACVERSEDEGHPALHFKIKYLNSWLLINCAPFQGNYSLGNDF